VIHHSPSEQEEQESEEKMSASEIQPAKTSVQQMLDKFQQKYI
jgi:hypothetical protein